MKPTFGVKPPPKQNSKESKEQYERRCARWGSWLDQEPLVDLSCVSDTEVAEYRQWAGTANWHKRMVDDLVAIGTGPKPKPYSNLVYNDDQINRRG